MFAITFRGAIVATFHCPVIAALIAIDRFTAGQIHREEVKVVSHA